jgi:heme-degrading monooxygenase HmoA
VIARLWRGVTAAADADAYLTYLQRTGLGEYRATPGNRAAVAIRRISAGRAEFVLLTLWDSHEAIRAFAGPDLDRAVFYPEDDRFLLERGERVDHFDVVFSAGDVCLEPRRS